ncbi:MAG: tRNA pseudouridine(55) synthase TruB, partial [Patescibacteria group bacterium]
RKKMGWMKNKIKNSGFLLINKEEGPTSHDLINNLRKITDIKKIGHAGTLDPFAEGLLIVAVGREATRKIDNFVKLNKEYEAVVVLGLETDSLDKTGNITKRYNGEKVEKKHIINALKKIKRRREQTPPMYSAKKINGKKLYELARKNIEIERRPQKIKIHSIKTLNYQWPILSLKIKCSSGTYIRTIAKDIGDELKCGAYLHELKRTQIGRHRIEGSFKINQLENDTWQNKLFQHKKSLFDILSKK